MSTAEKIEETPVKGKTKEKEEEKTELVRVESLSAFIQCCRKMLCHFEMEFCFLFVER